VIFEITSKVYTLSLVGAKGNIARDVLFS